MLSKEEIEKAKKIAQNYIKDTPILPYDCLMNIERKSAETLLQYINQLEFQIQAKEKEHKYDVNIIDEVKGEVVKLYKEINKQNKIIYEMVTMLEELKICYFKKEDGGELLGKYRCYNKDDWKQYFEKKVEEK